MLKIKMESHSKGTKNKLFSMIIHLYGFGWNPALQFCLEMDGNGPNELTHPVSTTIGKGL